MMMMKYFDNDNDNDWTHNSLAAPQFPSAKILVGLHYLKLELLSATVMVTLWTMGNK